MYSKARPSLMGTSLVCTYEAAGDRKSTRLNSSHLVISYAVFCLKKKKQTTCQLLALDPLIQHFRLAEAFKRKSLRTHEHVSVVTRPCVGEGYSPYTCCDDQSCRV